MKRLQPEEVKRDGDEGAAYGRNIVAAEKWAVDKLNGR